ncbi:hypothetical protein [Agrobacterium deltaense]|uniref:hypothetical protein n=1 Tax=Agrobacterium deltaense TaxID=1183412 RepID=UPI0009BB78FD|nr:hypothetical protein [Agrobacterium deltaense]
MDYQLEDDAVQRHQMAVEHYGQEIEYLTKKRHVHFTTYDNDDTPRMLGVAVASKHRHEVWLRLYQR